MTQATTDPAATLAAIIREVDHSQRLRANAFARAILAHPASQWGPAALWPELSEKPPNAEEPWGNLWEQGYRDGWRAARAELQRLREQAGAAPTPAPAFPEISDRLIEWLIREVLNASASATNGAGRGRLYNPVPYVRDRLIEALQAVKRPAS